MHSFAYKNGTLYCENVNLQELADKEEQLRQATQQMEEAQEQSEAALSAAQAWAS